MRPDVSELSDDEEKDDNALPEADPTDCTATNHQHHEYSDTSWTTGYDSDDDDTPYAGNPAQDTTNVALTIKKPRNLHYDEHPYTDNGDPRDVYWNPEIDIFEPGERLTAFAHVLAAAKSDSVRLLFNGEMRNVKVNPSKKTFDECPVWQAALVAECAQLN